MNILQTAINSMQLWWALNSVPVPLVIGPKIVQWRSERRGQVQSYVNQTELASE